jgi:hypothetical protein
VTSNVGVVLGARLSRDCYECRPFKFDGKISRVKVDLK